MRESFSSILAKLRGRTWPIVIGMVAGGAAVLFAGEAMFWALVALALAAAMIAQFVTFQEPVLRTEQQDPDDPLALLPPLTRLLLEQLPMPVMLLDGTERVLFVNQSMRDVLGPGLDRKRASAVLRNPEVLAAITNLDPTTEAPEVAVTRLSTGAGFAFEPRRSLPITPV